MPKEENKKQDNKKQSKDRKHLMKDVKAELKRVIWPTPKQLVNSTIAVITIVLITAIIVFVLDLAFESLNKYGVDKIKQSIQTIESTNTDDSNTTENEATDTENTSAEENSTDAETTNETTGENQSSNDTNAVE